MVSSPQHRVFNERCTRSSPSRCTRPLCGPRQNLGVEQRAIVTRHHRGRDSCHFAHLGRLSNPLPANSCSAVPIQWPGYEPWADTNSIHQFNHRQHVNRRSLEFIAHQVARSVKAFYENRRHESGTEAGWKLSGIRFEDLYLLELHHVSRGSWQPVLALGVD
ncbi:hypothetical protein PHLGIDRAFT_461880 [Phlebiopsis gigantea 11061_1 CR5-6]|uniref:Uncharacterized protein n=1 Tax=Phlebiopsis gigantea (strain 11061_1 CR5-6) TaxID=745531 RepID=A0A0C3NMX0_PHLG1|nr:hypothetical protein PHLGIDRAFT_461880 [Phlebiopsis gigantea 11061_1 CR5-6]